MHVLVEDSRLGMHDMTRTSHSLHRSYFPGVSKREVRSFMLEVAVLSRLSHPSIVRLLGACLRLPHICIVEELMVGARGDVV